MAAVTPLIRATCRNTCEMSLRCWPLAWTVVKMMHRLRECLKLAELPEALAIVQAARKGALDSKRGGKGKTRQDNVYPVLVNSDTMTTDRLRSSGALYEPASATQRHGPAIKVG